MHALNIRPEFLKKIQDNVIQFRLTNKDKPVCSCPVKHLEQFETYNLFKAFRSDDEDLLLLSGFSSFAGLDDIMRASYGKALFDEPFFVFHLSEVEMSCPGDDVIEQS